MGNAATSVVDGRQLLRGIALEQTILAAANLDRWVISFCKVWCTDPRGSKKGNRADIAGRLLAEGPATMKSQRENLVREDSVGGYARMAAALPAWERAIRF